MEIILNQIAIWRPCGATKLNVRPAPVGTRYKTTDSPVYNQLAHGEVLNRFAKDYEIRKGKNIIKFSLFTRSNLGDGTFVETQLDACAKKLTAEYVLKSLEGADIVNFVYTPYFIKMESN